jgi:hypothetical protein
MELFPSAHAASWKIIRKAMDESDYVVLVLGSEYGSVGDNGLSFTEMEYEYAIRKRIPVLAFLREGRPRALVNRRQAKQIEDFKKRIKAHNYTKWRSRRELITNLAAALTFAIESNKRPGWIRPSVSIASLEARSVRQTGFDKIALLMKGIGPNWPVDVFLQIFSKGKGANRGADGLKKDVVYPFDRHGELFVLDKRKIDVDTGSPCKLYCAVPEKYRMLMYSVLCDNFFVVTGRGDSLGGRGDIRRIWFLTPEEPVSVISSNPHTVNHSFVTSAYPQSLMQD